MEPEQYEPTTKVADERYYGASLATDAKTPPGQVMRAYGDLGSSLGHLGETIDRLRVKLEPILGISHPQPENGNKSEAYIPSSPLADSL